MKNLFNVLVPVSLLALSGCTKSFYTNIQPGHRNMIVNVAVSAGLSGQQPAISAADPYSDAAFNNEPTPLANGFAHNDYRHKRPLFEALENGFINIEADIFLKNNKLIVAHILPYFKGSKTLEALYLQPLFDRVVKNNGKVFRSYDKQVTLMIDIKTGAEKTYNALKALLEKFRPMLTSYDNGQVIYRAVTIIISGNKPYAAIKNEQHRLAFIDKDLRKVTNDSLNNNVFSMASCKYSSLLSWDGNGSLPAIQKSKLCAVVAMAHKMGVKVRLWASPEKKAVWNELLSCGVDLINTDRLADLKNYLTMPVGRDLYSTIL